ncbi:MAG: hypothetical protein IKP63_06970, partial [Paludibacteraceae bacterium]|nr:hypothetical protein [Paludibacteraceae bacterium]
GDCVKFADDSKEVGQSVVLNTKTRELFVKLCNVSGEAKKATVDLSRFKIGAKAVKTVLTGVPYAENNYDNHPVSPVDETVKVAKKMSVEVAPSSLVMYTIKL